MRSFLTDDETNAIIAKIREHCLEEYESDIFLAAQNLKQTNIFNDRNLQALCDYPINALNLSWIMITLSRLDCLESWKCNLNTDIEAITIILQHLHLTGILTKNTAIATCRVMYPMVLSTLKTFFESNNSALDENSFLMHLSYLNEMQQSASSQGFWQPNPKRQRRDVHSDIHIFKP